MFAAGDIKGIFYVSVRVFMGDFLDKTLSVKINVCTAFHDVGS